MAQAKHIPLTDLKYGFAPSLLQGTLKVSSFSRTTTFWLAIPLYSKKAVKPQRSASAYLPLCLCHRLTARSSLPWQIGSSLSSLPHSGLLHLIFPPPLPYIPTKVSAFWVKCKDTEIGVRSLDSSAYTSATQSSSEGQNAVLTLQDCSKVQIRHLQGYYTDLRYSHNYTKISTIAWHLWHLLVNIKP